MIGPEAPAGDRTHPVPHLVELAVTDLGIIEQVSVVLEPGVTALTGETGAGKTLIVGALDLLLGGRADSTMVRTGASEAVVQGRFDTGTAEVVLTRVVPATGRSRAYVDGRMVTAAELSTVAGDLIDIHGQHAHQSLLTASTQREALDRFAEVDLTRLNELTARRRAVQEELSGLGGDAGARARELDLLEFQLSELDGAALSDPDEDAALDALEDLLSSAFDHQVAAASAVEVLTGEGGTSDALSKAIASIEGHGPFEGSRDRLVALQAEAQDVANDLRVRGESIEDDPERLAEVRQRRQLLVDLRRKYGTAQLGERSGSGTLADVIAYRDEAQARAEALRRHAEVAAALEADLAEIDGIVAEEAHRVGNARRAAAPELARTIANHLTDLAMPDAVVEVTVGHDDPGDQVEFRLAANRGSDPGPLSRVASGGELARTMLAARLAVTSSPRVLVFDEVDAGIGGTAALAVGRALSNLGRRHQVLVVTHLAQVAAFADHQIHIRKDSEGERTTTAAQVIDGEERIVEISRMLSGTPDSDQVQRAAAELLSAASAERGSHVR